MVKIEKKYCEISTNALSSPDHIYFYDLGEHESPHQIGNDLESICAGVIFEELKGKVTPLLTLDLNILNQNYNGHIHLFYHELTMMDWVITRLDENHQVTEMNFIDYEGNTYQMDQIQLSTEGEDSTGDAFEEGADEIRAILLEAKKKFFHTFDGPNIPEDIVFNSTSRDEYSDFVSRVSREYAENTFNTTGKSKYPKHFGPYTEFIQSNCSMPYSKITGEAFIFVGQIAASLFGLADFEYFIFYNPQEKIVAQLIQMT